MNKYEKAIKYFEEHKAKFAAMSFEDEAVENIGTALEVLRKQVPRAAVGGMCPNCKTTSVDRELDYCDNCGQALDWVTTDCIHITCEYCCYPDDKSTVCPRYAAKTDEIRRIHEEAGNGNK